MDRKSERVKGYTFDSCTCFSVLIVTVSPDLGLFDHVKLKEENKDLFRKTRIKDNTIPVSFL